MTRDPPCVLHPRSRLVINMHLIVICAGDRGSLEPYRDNDLTCSNPYDLRYA